MHKQPTEVEDAEAAECLEALIQAHLDRTAHVSNQVLSHSTALFICAYIIDMLQCPMCNTDQSIPWYLLLFVQFVKTKPGPIPCMPPYDRAVAAWDVSTPSVLLLCLQIATFHVVPSS